MDFLKKYWPWIKLALIITSATLMSLMLNDDVVVYEESNTQTIKESNTTTKYEFEKKMQCTLVDATVTQNDIPVKRQFQFCTENTKNLDTFSDEVMSDPDVLNNKKFKCSDIQNYFTTQAPLKSTHTCDHQKEYYELFIASIIIVYVSLAVSLLDTPVVNFKWSNYLLLAELCICLTLTALLSVLVYKSENDDGHPFSNESEGINEYKIEFEGKIYTQKADFTHSDRSYKDGFYYIIASLGVFSLISLIELFEVMIMWRNRRSQSIGTDVSSKNTFVTQNSLVF